MKLHETGRTDAGGRPMAGARRQTRACMGPEIFMFPSARVKGP